MSKLAKSEKAQKHRRHFGKRSPLDRVSDELKAELRRRCAGTDTLLAIVMWLKREHTVKTSISSLSDWWIRQRVNGWEDASRAVVSSGSFEIFVTAPGAKEIRVRVNALPAVSP